MSGQKSKPLTVNRPLPPIPDKLYFTIGEVSYLCETKPHVLRYWEQEFSQISPAKRRGNRRYYSREDVLVIRRIRHLLYEEGFTIEGAKRQLIRETKKSNPHSLTSVSDTVRELQMIIDLLESDPLDS